MTCTRKPLTEKAALEKAIRLLGDDAISSATGKSASLYRKISHPDSAANISFKDAVAIDTALHNAGHPRLFSELWDYATKTETNPDHQCLFITALEIGDAVGNYHAVTRSVWADGRLDLHEAPEYMAAIRDVERRARKAAEAVPSALERSNGPAGATLILRTAKELQDTVQ